MTESLREAGLLVANGPLHGSETATTVRVRDGETELTDGPFAVTKEILAGYYPALRRPRRGAAVAARLPTPATARSRCGRSDVSASQRRRRRPSGVSAPAADCASDAIAEAFREERPPCWPR